MGERRMKVKAGSDGEKMRKNEWGRYNQSKVIVIWWVNNVG
jgi:hypothetical protein